MDNESILEWMSAEGNGERKRNGRGRDSSIELCMERSEEEPEVDVRVTLRQHLSRNVFECPVHALNPVAHGVLIAHVAAVGKMRSFSRTPRHESKNAKRTEERSRRRWQRRGKKS